MNDAKAERIGDAPRDNETRFHLLLDTLPFVAFVIAPGGRAQYYNQRFIDYHGFRPGSDKSSRTNLLHPEDRSQLVNARRSAAATASEYIVEARLLRHDGAYRWHRIHNKPLIRDGQVEGWLGTAIDIHDVLHANEILEQRVSKRTAELEAVNRHLTSEIVQRQQTEEDLRASEARYRLLYNRTPMALHSVDPEARLIDVNDTWLAMFECTREEVIGRCPTEFMTPESAERYRLSAWPELLASDGQLRIVDYQFLTRSGRVFDGRLASSGEFDSAGRFVRSWAAIADVTAEKRADRELRQAQRMEAIGQLTAGIAHDFNNLLTAILGNLELLAKRPLQDQARSSRLIAGARAAAERGAKLTAQLLAFARKQRIAVEPVDLNGLVQGMAPLLRSTIGSNIGIAIKGDSGVSVALADPTQLELAILNLALNARDAMLGGGMITIETADVVRGEPAGPEEPAPGTYVAVSVSDTGSGIPNAVRERMFESFFTTKEVGKGSGMGLPQVLGVVKQLGGGLTVCSTPNEGTCISIFLPRACTVAETIVSPATAARKIEPGRRPRILLVDDDADARAKTAGMLSDAGYEVGEVSSGAAALDALKRSGSRTDLMVADVALPGLDGVTLAAIVQRTWPGLPVLLMTGYADEAQSGLAVGHDVLRKPFQAAELDAKVRRAIGRSGRLSADEGSTPRCRATLP
jgi:PAS domain S-box-containing protein